jgi:hypothetical protein
VIQVPAAEERDVEKEALDILEEAPDQRLQARPPRREESRRPRPIRNDPEEEEERPRSRESPPAKKVRKRTERQPRVAFEDGWFGSTNSGVIGGVLMILIAVGWFIAGLAADRIFIYPPILFVIGLVAMVKGIFGAS